MAPALQPAPTLFAPGERHSAETLRIAVRSLIEDPVVRTILRSIPGSVLVLNRERQILAANREILDTLGLRESATLVGLRPGEAFSCIHADEGPSGCGTSRHCSVCGAVIAMLAALERQEPVREECTLSTSHGGRLKCANLAVYAAPVTVQGTPCLELVFHDVSDARMREALNRLFLHDLRNACVGVLGWSELVGAADHGRAASQLLRATSGLMELVESQACLLSAESGDLHVTPAEVSAAGILDTLEATLAASQYTQRGVLEVERNGDSAGTRVRTDPALLNRVLVNMVKNAFEAISAGERVSVSFSLLPDDRASFSVHNPGTIPEEVQLRLFQRSFSTKGGQGRGFGTYGMKLLAQNYLRAEVGFESAAATGTRFFIHLPATATVRPAAGTPAARGA